MLSFTLFWFLPICWQTWYLNISAVVLLILDSWPCTFMPQPKKTPFPSAISLASGTLPVLCAQKMNGHSLFATFLARNVQHSPIDVCLSGVRTLHIDQGFPDLLRIAFAWRGVVCGIKCWQGCPSFFQLPILDGWMLIQVGSSDGLGYLFFGVLTLSTRIQVRGGGMERS